MTPLLQARFALAMPAVAIAGDAGAGKSTKACGAGAARGRQADYAKTLRLA